MIDVEKFYIKDDKIFVILEKKEILIYNGRRKEGKLFIYNLKDNSLIDKLDVIYFEDNFIIVNKNDKYAILKVDEGFITDFIDYEILPVSINFVNHGYLVVDNNGKTRFRYAIFKLNNTIITDWFEGIKILKINNDEVYFIGRKDDKHALFSTKKGMISDWHSYFDEDNVKLFLEGKTKYMICGSRFWKTESLIDEKGNVILKGKKIFPIFCEDDKLSDIIYLVLTNNKKILFYDGYKTAKYNLIFPANSDLDFLLVGKKRNKIIAHLFNVKTKQIRELNNCLFISKNIVPTIVYNFCGFYKCSFYEKRHYLKAFVYSYSPKFCPTCKKVWFFYFYFSSLKKDYCPICEAEKVYAFMI
jgi:hypothetical protein